MTIENSHFYGTHGISIGSETNAGVSNILFKNDTLSGTDSSGITQHQQQRHADQELLKRRRPGLHRHATKASA